MTLWKDDATVRLDDVTRAADEAAALYEDLLERVEPPLREAVARQIRTHAALTARIAAERRSVGDLPPAGDPERAHLTAAGAALQAAVAPREPEAAYAESLERAAERVASAADAALALELDDTLATPLRELAESSRNLAAAARRARE